MASAIEESVEYKVEHINRSEASRRTGIHISHISRVFSGKRSASSNNLKQLSEYLGVTMDDLYRCLAEIRQRHLKRRAREERVYGKRKSAA
jgi:transcriptional regulator with XRE-family HTH domain